MVPVAEYFKAYRVETRGVGLEIVPFDVCGDLNHLPGNAALDALAQYVEGLPIGYEPIEGWFARLSAPGFLDCTAWDGPHATADEALAAVRETFDVDADGNEHE